MPNPVQHQIRRGTNAQMGSFTGAVGEFTMDTTFNRAVMHDGATPGGWPTALASLQTSTASTTINATTAVFLGFSTTAQSLTLPSAANYPPGQRLFIGDGGGNAGTANITVNTAAATDLMYTSAGATSTTYVINVAGRHMALYSNSSNHWLLESTN